jgi:hypothetical protein
VPLGCRQAAWAAWAAWITELSPALTRVERGIASLKTREAIAPPSCDLQVRARQWLEWGKGRRKARSSALHQIADIWVSRLSGILPEPAASMGYGLHKIWPIAPPRLRRRQHVRAGRSTPSLSSCAVRDAPRFSMRKVTGARGNPTRTPETPQRSRPGAGRPQDVDRPTASSLCATPRSPPPLRPSSWEWKPLSHSIDRTRPAFCSSFAT